MRASLFFLSLVLLLLSCTFQGCRSFKTQSLVAYQEARADSKVFDAIIVPGIPFEKLKNNYLLKSRITWAWVLYKNGVVKNIIFSGGAVYTAQQEAKVMGFFAEKFGIPRERIYYDTCAQHSVENLYYSYLLAKKLGFKKLALATDPYQTRFLSFFIKRKFRSPLYCMPFVKDSLIAYEKNFPMLDSVVVDGNSENFVPLNRKENYFQRMRGTFGGNINWSRHNEGKVESL